MCSWGVVMCYVMLCMCCLVLCSIVQIYAALCRSMLHCALLEQSQVARVSTEGGCFGTNTQMNSWGVVVCYVVLRQCCCMLCFADPYCIVQRQVAWVLLHLLVHSEERGSSGNET
jgi:hypothetical protein